MVLVVEGASLRDAWVGWVVENRRIRRVVAARLGGWGRRLRMKLRHDAQRGAYCVDIRAVIN